MKIMRKVARACARLCKTLLPDRSVPCAVVTVVLSGLLAVALVVKAVLPGLLAVALVAKAVPSPPRMRCRSRTTPPMSEDLSRQSDVTHSQPHQGGIKMAWEMRSGRRVWKMMIGPPFGPRDRWIHNLSSLDPHARGRWRRFINN